MGVDTGEWESTCVRVHLRVRDSPHMQLNDQEPGVECVGERALCNKHDISVGWVDAVVVLVNSECCGTVLMQPYCHDFCCVAIVCVCVCVAKLTLQEVLIVDSLHAAGVHP